MKWPTVKSSRFPLWWIALLAVAITAAADGVNFYFRIENDCAIFTGVNSTLIGTLPIPSTYNGYPVTAIAPNAFSYNNALRAYSSVIVPEGVTNIGQAAFFDRIWLTNVVLPNSLTGLGADAFSGCSRLKQIHLPPQLKTIASGTFEFCSTLSQVTLPPDLETLEVNAFAHCTALEQIVIPAGVINLGPDIFFNCPNLRHVFFLGNRVETDEWIDLSFGTNVTIYYLPQATGWPATYMGRPTALWNPQFTAAESPATIQLNSTPGIPVGIQWRSNLLTGAWRTQTNFSAPGTQDFQPAAGPGFYRIARPD